jgi:MEDS: MEthanogen/methylotroph, DcmR Sensory domain
MTRDPHRALDGHSALLYGADEAKLVAYVVDWLAEHLAREYPVLVAVTPVRRRAIAAGLQRSGIDVSTMERRGLFSSLDAKTAAEQIIEHGPLPWPAFEGRFGELVPPLRVHGPVRAYGEVAGLLWKCGKREAAIELELCCNRLRTSVDFEMLCAYGIDARGSEFAIGAAEEIVRSHGTVIPLGGGDSLR